MNQKNAIIINIGDELLAGHTVNTNASTPVKVLRIKGKVVKPEQVKTTPEKERTSLMAK